jgi:proteasome lid subunit RPN8/RPN11
MYQEAIAQHAKEGFPNEVCGLIVEEKGNLVAVRTENVAEDPTQFFKIDPHVYFRAISKGNVRAIYHSHPTAEAKFTDSDKTTSEACELPLYVYSIREERLNVYIPNGFRCPYLGRAYVAEVHDCLTLAQDYYQWEYGIELTTVPRTPELYRRGNKNIGQWAEENSLEFIPVPEEPGDLILMSHRCTNYPNHLGIYLGERMFMHHLLDKPSNKELYAGYWEKISLRSLRHRSKL